MTLLSANKRPLQVAGVALALASSACSSQLQPGPRTGPVVASAFASDRAGDLCAGMSSPDQERPAFLRQEQIESVRPLHERRSSARVPEGEVRGAEIYVRPSPALTRTFVARALRCHLADPVALALHEPFEDPLLVGTPRVSLESSEEGLVIRIAGHDGAEGQEILRRAEGLQRN
jgi:hypothetical protein